MRFAIVVGSIRQNRVSDRMAKWVQKTAQYIAPEHEWALVDLKDYQLPQFDEPLPPMSGQRSGLSDNVTRYLKTMSEADGFVFVTPEYNHSTSSALLNAIDLLDFQLMKKPVMVAGHGVVGGARAIAHIKTIVNSNLGAVPMPTGFPMTDKVVDIISEDGDLLEAHDRYRVSLTKQLETLAWYAEALKTAREKGVE